MSSFAELEGSSRHRAGNSASSALPVEAAELFITSTGTKQQARLSSIATSRAPANHPAERSEIMNGQNKIKWPDRNGCGKHARNERREQNRERTPGVLRAFGLSFETNNDGVHLIVKKGTTVIDFWPGNGRWIDRANSDRQGHGIVSLLCRLNINPAKYKLIECPNCSGKKYVHAEYRGIKKHGQQICESCSGQGVIYKRKKKHRHEEETKSKVNHSVRRG